MFVDVGRTVSGRDVVVRRTYGADKWLLSFDGFAHVLMTDSELDAVKYALDSAVFDRDMGSGFGEFAAHFEDDSVDDLVHGADEGGRQ